MGMLQTPHGCCLNSTYHDRLHPHTNAIYDDPMDVLWESMIVEEDESTQNTESKPQTPSNPFAMMKASKVNKPSNNSKESEVKEEDYCQIYDTIQHEYVKQYICPYLVGQTIKNYSSQKRKQIDNDNELKFEPKLGDDLGDRIYFSECKKYYCAEQFRKHAIEGNFDNPSSIEWFEYYQEFISTICINEHHRQKIGGTQYRQGQEVRRSSRRKSCNQFEHILKGWLTDDDCQSIVQLWKQSFDGMGWKTDTLPVL